jgi:hypothetical protein
MIFRINLEVFHQIRKLSLGLGVFWDEKIQAEIDKIVFFDQSDFLFNPVIRISPISYGEPICRYSKKNNSMFAVVDIEYKVFELTMSVGERKDLVQKAVLESIVFAKGHSRKPKDFDFDLFYDLVDKIKLKTGPNTV